MALDEDGRERLYKGVGSAVRQRRSKPTTPVSGANWAHPYAHRLSYLISDLGGEAREYVGNKSLVIEGSPTRKVVGGEPLTNLDGTDDAFDLTGNLEYLRGLTGPVSMLFRVAVTAEPSMALSIGNASSSDVFFVGLGQNLTSGLTNELIMTGRTVGGVQSCAQGYTTANRNELFDGAVHTVMVTSNGSAWKIFLDGSSKTITVSAGTNDGLINVTGATGAAVGKRFHTGSPLLMTGGISLFALWERDMSEFADDLHRNPWQLFPPEKSNHALSLLPKRQVWTPRQTRLLGTSDGARASTSIAASTVAIKKDNQTQQPEWRQPLRPEWQVARAHVWLPSARKNIVSGIAVAQQVGATRGVEGSVAKYSSNTADAPASTEQFYPMVTGVSPYFTACCIAMPTAVNSNGCFFYQCNFSNENGLGMASSSGEEIHFSANGTGWGFWLDISEDANPSVSVSVGGCVVGKPVVLTARFGPGNVQTMFVNGVRGTSLTRSNGVRRNSNFMRFATTGSGSLVRYFVGELGLYAMLPTALSDEWVGENCKSPAALYNAVFQIQPRKSLIWTPAP